jgi:sterol 14-demethylase
MLDWSSFIGQPRCLVRTSIVANLTLNRKRAREEAESVIGKTNVAEYDQIKNLNYLEAVIKETLRLRPPIIIMMRRVVKDMQFREYTIHEGDIVAVSPALSHRLDNFYTNPEKFDPDRFFVREEDKKNPFSFISFGAGKHGKNHFSSTV